MPHPLMLFPKLHPRLQEPEKSAAAVRPLTKILLKAGLSSSKPLKSSQARPVKDPFLFEETLVKYPGAFCLSMVGAYPSRCLTPTVIKSGIT